MTYSEALSRQGIRGDEKLSGDVELAEGLPGGDLPIGEAPRGHPALGGGAESGDGGVEDVAAPGEEAAFGGRGARSGMRGTP